MNPSFPRVEKCPGLRRTETGAVTFTDSAGRIYDLERQPVLRPKEAAADERLAGLSAWVVRAMVARGELYTVFRKNSRVILIYDCALTEWRARGLRKIVPRRPPPTTWANVPGVFYIADPR